MVPNEQIFFKIKWRFDFLTFFTFHRVINFLYHTTCLPVAAALNIFSVSLGSHGFGFLCVGFFFSRPIGVGTLQIAPPPFRSNFIFCPSHHQTGERTKNRAVLPKKLHYSPSEKRSINEMTTTCEHFFNQLCCIRLYF